MIEESIQIFQFQGIEIDRSRFTDKAYLLKKVHQILTNPNRPFDYDSLHVRVALVGLLEKILHTNFSDTRDINHKVADFLHGYDLRKSDPKTRTRKKRKKLKLTQQQLAQKLGYSSHVPIAQIENGNRPPSKRVLRWLEEAEM